MRIFGLIGFPLGHSFSKKYFTEKFARESITDCLYENYPITEIMQLRPLLDKNPDISGLNVTIPYKASVLQYLDEIAPDAKEIGAVNVVKINASDEGKVLKGFNSDVFGFRESFEGLIKDKNSRALVLGTGGSSKAVAYVLRQLGIEFSHVSRKSATGIITYSDLTGEIIENHRIIINTTPVGMYPDIQSCPAIPYKYIGAGHLLYDLVYNPELTEFLRRGKERGCRVEGGTRMLHLQAERSWSIWNDPLL